MRWVKGLKLRPALGILVSFETLFGATGKSNLTHVLLGELDLGNYPDAAGVRSAMVMATLQ